MLSSNRLVVYSLGCVTAVTAYRLFAASWLVLPPYVDAQELSIDCAFFALMMAVTLSYRDHFILRALYYVALTNGVLALGYLSDNLVDFHSAPEDSAGHSIAYNKFLTHFMTSFLLIAEAEHTRVRSDTTDWGSVPFVSLRRGLTTGIATYMLSLTILFLIAAAASVLDGPQPTLRAIMTLHLSLGARFAHTSGTIPWLVDTSILRMWAVLVFAIAHLIEEYLLQPLPSPPDDPHSIFEKLGGTWWGAYAIGYVSYRWEKAGV